MRRYLFLATLFLLLLNGSALSRTREQLGTIQLSEPKFNGKLSLEQTLELRRSSKNFDRKELSISEMGQILWAGQGITDKENGFRTAPSAGDIYPLTLYVITNDGLFSYDPKKHCLNQLSDQKYGKKLSQAANNQDYVENAPCSIVIAGETKKLGEKYGKDAKKFMTLEAGHAAQNILLQATAMDLSAVPLGSFEEKSVRKICSLPLSIDPLYIICIGHPSQNKVTEETKKMEKKTVKKAALIIASQGFRDEELFDTKAQLENAGIQTAIVSSVNTMVTGMLGGTAQPEIFINDLVVNDYDAVIFVGGLGAKEYFNSKVAHEIAKQAVLKRKVLAAICIAPSTLANAGVLEGIKATSYSSEKQNLIAKGANFTGDDVIRDGLIITGSGPTAARKFGKTIADAVLGK
jgi:protease I